MVRRPVRALLASPEVGNGHRADAGPGRHSARCCRTIRGSSVARRAAPSPQTIAEQLRRSRRRVAAAGDDRRSCAARPGDGRRIHRARRTAPTSPSRVVERKPLLDALPADASGPGSVSAAAPTAAPTCSRSARRKVLPAIALWRRSSRTARRAGGCLRRSGPALLLGAVLQLRTLHASAAAIGRKLGLDDPHRRDEQPARRGRRRQAGRPCAGRGHHRGPRMSDLAIYDMDRTVTRHATYTPFLLHCALRRAPWRLLLLPFVALSMLAYVARLIDRAQAQGDQPSAAARRRDPSARSEAAGRQLRRRQIAGEHPAGRATGDRARQGSKGAGWSWRPPPTGSTPTQSRSGSASTT